MSWSENHLIDAASLKRLEQQAETDGQQLMDKAGAAIAVWLQNTYDLHGLHILIVAGPGNNGGDALLAAIHLQQSGFAIQVCQPTPPVTQQASKARQQFEANGGMIHERLPDQHFDILLDGIFGAGLHRPPTGSWPAIMKQLASIATICIAIDVPSGLNAWHGSAHPDTIAANHTLALVSHKPGLFTADGPDFAGTIHLLTLDCPTALYPPQASGSLIRQATALPSRKHNSHKGSYGTINLVGGCAGMAGALLLAGRSALALGSGKVILHTLDERLLLDPLYPELMISPFQPSDSFADCVIGIGPGLGRSENAVAAMYRAFSHKGALVMDADALNLLADFPQWKTLLPERALPAILTPHPLEAARLLTCDTQTIQRDRLAAARKIARDYQSIVLLKGAGSIVCQPDGQYAIVAAGNAALANAGQGDVLTGAICALLAQGMTPWQASCSAAFLHANSANRYAIEAPSLIGLHASHSIALMRQQLSQS